MTTVTVPFSAYLNNSIGRLLNGEKFVNDKILNFSCKDEVGSSLIALDIPKRKLFISKKHPACSACLIIDLKNVVSCTLKKQYNAIQAGDLNHKKLPNFLKALFLNLGFINSTHTLSLPFFDALKDKPEDAEQMEEKAKYWQALISKLLSIQIKERA